MSWWTFITGARPGLPADISFKLKAARFHRMLENHKKFDNLLEDAAEKLGGGYVIDRQFLAGLLDRSFGIATEIVCDMNVLHGDSAYFKHYFKLDSLKANLRRVLAWQPQVESGEPVLPFSEIDELDHYHQVGGVFTRLAEIRQRLGILVPEGFVISIAAFNQFAEYNGMASLMEIASPIASPEMDKLRTKIRNATIPQAVFNRVNEHLAEISESYGPDARFVMNAAAFGQEYTHFPPGDFQTIAGVGAEDVFDTYRKLISRMYSPPTVIEREEMGLPARCHIAVAVSLMVPAHVDGSVQSVNPAAPHWDCMHVNVSSGSDTRTIEVSRHAPYEIKTDPGPGFPLSAQDIAGLAEKTMRIERYFKGPQEIKWARTDNGDLYVISTRPLELDPDKRFDTASLADSVSKYETRYARTGKVASPGVSYGVVYKPDKENSIANLPERGILVADHLEPDMELLHALKKAAAILMDHGSQAGHVASLAREFHVPAIVGLGDATTRLSPGDMITVDADENVIFDGIVEELLNYQLWEYLDLDIAREYVLLRFVLHRLSSRNYSGSRSRRLKLKSRDTLDTIVRGGIDNACQDIEAAMKAAKYRIGESAVRIENPSGLKLSLLDVGDALDISRETDRPSKNETAGMAAIRSLPLLRFMQGLSDTGFKFPASDAGGAVASGELLLLSMNTGSRTVTLFANMTGEMEYDYIYGRVSDTASSSARSGKQTMWLQEVLDRYGFSTYRLNDGFTAWKYDMAVNEMEQALRLLGTMLGYAQAEQDITTDSVEDEIEKLMKIKGDKVCL